MSGAKAYSATGCRGFTLVQMALLVLVLGLLMAAAAATYHAYLKQNHFDTNTTRQAAIQAAIANFYYSNGRLPCVAPRNVPETSPNFGKEITTSCKLFPSPGAPGVNYLNTFRANGNTGVGKVRIGAVPVRTLGLDDRYIADVSGYLFIYAVSEDLAESTIYGLTPLPSADLTLGVIDVRDYTNSYSVLDNSPPFPAAAGNCGTIVATSYVPPIHMTVGAPPAGTANPNRYAVYTVIDPGASGIGAYTMNGLPPATVCGGVSKDAFNCRVGNPTPAAVFLGGGYKCVLNSDGLTYSYTYNAELGYSED